MAFHELRATKANGTLLDFASLKQNIVLITNVASRCGFTHSHYTELAEVYAKFQHRGLRILAFPCNQFGRQEPGTDAEIESHVCNKYNATFDIMSKIDVNGPNTDPVYTFLKENTDGQDIRWNFRSYFLVDKAGAMQRFDGKSPRDLISAINTLLPPEENPDDDKD
ncbi:glutathione peroxidase 1 [Salpingoeca rosetta]|uniref:Glutathione peroxidase n=1 Tax=Salpingoeca rosetta (strain ATCC 50818 / BSB-021) TaxID=946362 RepID=F2UK26_SALR5|nr:glutathione peroxidase 1 [Salpingoeca rosetta]EGD77475.1 glutathione peroxidase 1 [Salpingoeca rosetta]|eukprot:XP_004990363.1 glutathione peroxidase 1 [Salpingoeca rosetta]